MKTVAGSDSRGSFGMADAWGSLWDPRGAQGKGQPQGQQLLALAHCFRDYVDPLQLPCCVLKDF